jgi:hypothetical protein
VCVQRGPVFGPVSAAIADVDAVCILVEKRESVTHCRVTFPMAQELVFVWPASLMCSIYCPF